MMRSLESLDSLPVSGRLCLRPGSWTHFDHVLTQHVLPKLEVLLHVPDLVSQPRCSVHQMLRDVLISAQVDSCDLQSLAYYVLRLFVGAYEFEIVRSDPTHPLAKVPHAAKLEGCRAVVDAECFLVDGLACAKQSRGKK